MSFFSSVGNGPEPTLVEYAFVTPTTLLIDIGGSPRPVIAPPTVALDDVTNG